MDFMDLGVLQDDLAPRNVIIRPPARPRPFPLDERCLVWLETDADDVRAVMVNFERMHVEYPSNPEVVIWFWRLFVYAVIEDQGTVSSQASSIPQGQVVRTRSGLPAASKGTRNLRSVPHQSTTHPSTVATTVVHHIIHKLREHVTLVWIAFASFSIPKKAVVATPNFIYASMVPMAQPSLTPPPRYSVPRQRSESIRKARFSPEDQCLDL